MNDYRQIISKIKNREFAPVYILMGEEPYYIDLITSALEETTVAEEDKEFDQFVIYGADANASLLMEAAGQLPLMSEKRLVILKEGQAIPRAAKNELDKLKPYILQPNPNTVLCIVYKGDRLNATSEILRAAKKNKEIIVFESPLVKDYKLGELIKDYCFSNKIKIEEKAIEILISNIGSSIANLYSQIDKLRVSLTGKQNVISADIVYDLIGVSKENNVFELLNALSSRDYFNSLKIVNNLEDHSKSKPTQQITGALFKYFQQLVIAAFEEDKSDANLMSALQLKNTYSLRDVRAGLRNYNASQLVNAIHAIRDFDTKSKGIGSTQHEYLLLKELVLRILTL